MKSPKLGYMLKENNDGKVANPSENFKVDSGTRDQVTSNPDTPLVSTTEVSADPPRRTDIRQPHEVPLTLSDNQIGRHENARGSASKTDDQQGARSQHPILLPAVRHPSRLPLLLKFPKYLARRIAQPYYRREHLKLMTRGGQLYKEYKVHFNQDTLDIAISCLQKALLKCPTADDLRFLTLLSLGRAIQTRADWTGNLEDIQAAINYSREALSISELDDDDRGVALNSLGQSLIARNKQKGGIEDLLEAIQCNRDALQLQPLRHPDRSRTLNSLGTTFWYQYRQQGGSDRLEEAIHCIREAVLLRPVGHAGRANSLTNLACFLQKRYESLGRIEDLEESAQCEREALELHPVGSLNVPTSLNNLAIAVQLQYRRQGGAEYLDEALQCHRHALLLRPPGHPERAQTLTNLADCLMQCYDDRHGTEQLNEGIQCIREALDLYPVGHPDRMSVLLNLGSALWKLYSPHGEIEVLEEGIQCLRDALPLRPSGHTERSAAELQLATHLGTRFKRLGSIEDLEAAVKHLKDSMEPLPENHPLLTQIWTSFAMSLSDHSDLLAGSYDTTQATHLFEKASNHESASVKDRFMASLRWIRRENGPRGLQAYRTCLELADRYLLVKSYIGARHLLLSLIPPTLATDATAFAIEAGDMRKAVEFSEQARTLVWSQMGRYRVPLEELQATSPGLAAELKKLSYQLEASATSRATTNTTQQSMEAAARKYRKIYDNWNSTVEQIRQLDGFDTFLQPPQFTSLQQAAENGPVIIVNISKRRSDALIVLKTGDPHVIPLPDAQLQDIARHSSDFSEALRESQAGAHQKSTHAKVIAILRALWFDVVQPVIATLQELNIANGSRIWWCPTSKLATLPLHAAGPYRNRQPNLTDIYICSYTPTLSALVKSSKPSQITDIPDILLVAQPNTKGQVEIPEVNTEISRIMEIVPSLEMLVAESGTREAVLFGLETHRWVHFACHGFQNLTHPFESCFHLHDGRLSLLDIIQAHLPAAEFAFLSACHSAAGDKERPDETIHLAAGLQFSGFRSVIGTMYAMADIDGPEVTTEVYKHMFRRLGDGMTGASESVVHYRDAAKALSIATKALRDKGVPIQRWINFVHIGA